MALGKGRPGGGGGWGGGGEPPQLDELLDRFRERFRVPGGGFLFVILLALWLASGFYIVRPDEVGVVLRFGERVKETGPGPHLALPFPIDRVYKPQVTKIQKHEIGFRTVEAGPPARYRGVPLESLMLTGDENIVDIWFIVQYRIKDPYKYLFAVVQPDESVRNAAESAMRSVIGRSQIDDVLTAGRELVQAEVTDRLQALLDAYDSGIQIERVQLTDVHPPQEVVAAFKDVASAREDKIRTVNQADGYRNDLLPKAKGEAARIENEAAGYAKEVVERAKGDVSRFSSVLVEYQRAKDVTRERIYLETLEQILPHVDKIILDAGKGRDVLPILPLRGGLSDQTAAAAAAVQENPETQEAPQ